MVILILLLFSGSVFAKSVGVISVLEAPLFAVPDDTTKVIQYLRKGEEIFLHPSELDVDLYDQEKFEATYPKYQQKYQDRFFTKQNTYIPDEADSFYKTIDNLGRPAYILKTHVVLRTNDSREMIEEVVEKDPTDYRVEEPLPENYPFLYQAEFRGHYALMLGRDNVPSFSYDKEIQDYGFDLVYGVDIIGAWPVKWDKDQLYFFGMQFNYQRTQSDVATIEASFEEVRASAAVGPYFAYDIWRTQDWLVTTHLGILFHFYESLEMIRRRDNEPAYTAQYSGLSFSGRIGTSLFVKNVLASLTGVVDISLFAKLPSRMRLVDSGSDFVDAGGNPIPIPADVAYDWADEVTTPFQNTMSISFGFQQAY
jgi:hypothetical protein